MQDRLKILENKVRALEDRETERVALVKAARIIGLLLGIAVSLLVLVQVTQRV